MLNLCFGLAMFGLIFNILYLGTCYKFFGLLPSISQSYYEWTQKNNSGWLFRAWCWITAMTILPFFCFMSNGRNLELFFTLGSVAPLIGVGLFPNFLNKPWEDKQIWEHSLFAAITAICAITFCILQQYLYVVCFYIGIFGIIGLCKPKSVTLWGELLALSSVFTMIIIYWYELLFYFKVLHL
jgi:hypothetical protein